jgi:hypothetical protein
MAQGDTTFLTSDSSLVQIKRGNETILIVNDKEEKQTSAETNWNTTLWIPLIIVVAGAIISYLINRSKTKSEIAKIDKESNKITEEIGKMQVETEMLKNSFLPHVLSTLQSVQNKVVDLKLTGLKRILILREDFQRHEQQFFEGEPIVPDYHEFIRLLFLRYSSSMFSEFESFDNEFSYLFPDKVLNELKDLKRKLKDLQESSDSYASMEDLELSIGKDSEKLVEDIIQLYDKCIHLIRTDCLLDNEFIHDFISRYKIKN